MIHPHTCLKFISDEMGYGVFATQLIPKGTITYVKDALEVEVTSATYWQYDNSIRAVIDKYSYIDERGIRIVSWDFAKYVNHCCHCNTMSTGYGFEIAIRDIQPGEEITDEYGLFNLDQDMEITCAKPHCRQKLTYGDLDKYYEEWDAKVLPPLRNVFEVAQPLAEHLDSHTFNALTDFIQDEANYKSVLGLKHAFKPTFNGVGNH